MYVLCAIGGDRLPTQLINTDLLYTAGNVFPLYVAAPLSLVRLLPSPLSPPLEAVPQSCAQMQLNYLLLVSL